MVKSIENLDEILICILLLQFFFNEVVGRLWITNSEQRVRILDHGINCAFYHVILFIKKQANEIIIRISNMKYIFAPFAIFYAVIQE